MPDWLKITAVTERESATRISEVLDTLGALAVTVESAEDDLDCDESYRVHPNGVAKRSADYSMEIPTPHR